MCVQSAQMAAVEFVSDRDSKAPDAVLAQLFIEAAGQEDLLVIKFSVACISSRCAFRLRAGRVRSRMNASDVAAVQAVS
ncbi:hypothetical protein D3C79_529230 [compost metagenome]